MLKLLEDHCEGVDEDGDDNVDKQNNTYYFLLDFLQLESHLVQKTFLFLVSRL